MNNINFAVIGCGNIGKRHLIHATKFGNLVAVCDTDKSKITESKLNDGISIFDNMSSLLSSDLCIDVVSVCTPNYLHAEHSISALNAGYHVICEKPMALNSADCEKMIEASIKNHRKLFIVKQNRFNPPVIALKKAISSNLLGKIYSIQLNCFWNRSNDYYLDSWKGSRLMDGGTLFTQFSHFIDLLYWLFGDLEDAYSIMNNFHHENIIEFEDAGVVIIKFKSGAIGTINFTINCFQKNMEGSIAIFGEKGTIKIGGQYLNELEYQNIENYVISNLPIGNPANNYGKYVGSMSNHDKIYKNVIDVLQQGSEISTSGSEGKATVCMIEKIYSSIIKK